MTLHEKVVISAYTGCLIVPFEQLDAYAQQLFGRRISEEEYKYPVFWELLKQRSFDDFLDIHFSLDLNKLNTASCSQRKHNKASGKPRCRQHRSNRLYRHK